MPADRNIPELTVPVVAIRADIALPILAEAPETTAWFSCSNFSWLTLYLTYTRGAGGGAVEFYLDWRHAPVTVGAAVGAYQMTAESVGVVAAGADTASLVQRENVTYTATGAAAESFAWGSVEIRGTAEDFRIVMRESGVTGTPGNFAINAQMAV